jgi:phage/plasmid-associated DNA primase
MPKLIRSVGRAFEEVEDTFGAWLEEDCELGDDFVATRQELYAAWVVWCRQRGEEPHGEKAFKRRMDARKLPLMNRQVGPRRQRGYRGIKLNLDLEMGVS